MNVNEQITSNPVRLVGDNGKHVGIVDITDALRYAEEKGLDLVEMQSGNPSVCKVMDYGKYKYELSVKKKLDARKNTSKKTKCIRLSPKIEPHDVETKVNQVRKLISSGHKVRFRLDYKNRENAHKEIGMQVINSVIEMLKDVAQVDKSPQFEGRSLICLISKKED